jgi:hypothetical protein
MKWFAFLLSVVCIPAISVAQSSPLQQGSVLSQLVDSVLHDVSTFHPGMPRRALTALFAEDGGLQFFGETRYDYRGCSAIKINVKFKPVSKASSGPMQDERDDDIIVEISNPYLEYPAYD